MPTQLPRAAWSECQKASITLQKESVRRCKVCVGRPGWRPCARKAQSERASERERASRLVSSTLTPQEREAGGAGKGPPGQGRARAGGHGAAQRRCPIVDAAEASENS